MNEITRETRLESYLTRPENRKAAVMAYILYHAPCTARQIMRGLNLPEPNNVRPRLTELLDEEAIQTVGKAVDDATGKHVAVYAPKGWTA